MDRDDARDIGRLAAAIGVVGVCSAASLATYFAVRGPFGTVNDIGNAAVGVLSATLARRLRNHATGRGRAAAVATAVAGAALTVVGSALVVSGTTGFLLAGLVSSVGFAGIGAWLVQVNRSEAARAWPRRLRSLGVVAGGLMAVGVVLVPGILLRLDDMAAAPGWVWVGFTGWLGTYVVYPAWALWLAAVHRRSAGAKAAVTPGAGLLTHDV